MDKQIYQCTPNGFIPANDKANAFFAKTKLGQLITMEAKQARNLRFHRRYFAILRLISENSNPHISEKAALHFAKMAGGVGELVTDSRGEKHFVPDSISFASMDQIKFREFVETSIPPVVWRFMAGTAPEAVIAEAMELAP